jgi:diguanylate cyclase (GGDEF)-like protein
MLWFVVITSAIHFGAAAVLYYVLCANDRCAPAASEGDSADEGSPTASTSGSNQSDGDAWIERLKEQGIAPESMIEAATHIARLDAMEYCDKLTSMELRLLGLAYDSPELAAIRDELRDLITDRLARNEEAVEQIDAIVKPLNEPPELADRLESVLLDEAAQVETTQSNLAALDDQDQESVLNLASELGRLLTCAHTVRDGTIDMLLAIATDELVAPEELAKVRGLERMFQMLIETDSALAEAGPGSLVLASVDVDQFCKINSSFGSTAGDRVIDEIEAALGEVAKSDDARIDRRHGANYTVTFRDTKKDAALSRVEQMCQAIAAISFTSGGESVSLTASAALVECEPKTNALDLFHRLDELVVDGRRSGRSRICVEGKAGNSSFQMKPGESELHTVSLEA